MIWGFSQSAPVGIGVGVVFGAAFVGLVRYHRLLSLRRDRASALQHINTEALERLGCPREEREYSPHLTLARFGDADTRALRRRVDEIGQPRFGCWRADEFHLYRSQTGGAHSVYTVLASWPLAKETMTA